MHSVGYPTANIIFLTSIGPILSMSLIGSGKNKKNSTLDF